MKIVIKHVDNLVSTFKSTTVTPQYLIYLMTEDGIKISCDIANGNKEKNKVSNQLISQNKNFTLPIHEISYEEFKSYNNAVN